MALNDSILNIILKECDCMMQYDVIDVPVDMVREKYICFAAVKLEKRMLQ